jgi:glutathione synthase/RimK-type ligase-like ATP-grasp enzyme
MAAARPHFRGVGLLRGAGLVSRVRPEDVVLARLDVRRSLDGIDSGLAELQELERPHSGPRILNRAGPIFVCHDKLATSLALCSAGVPHPRTACVAHPSQLRSFEPPVVVKPRLGRDGEDVHVCHSWHELARCFRRIAARPWYRRQGALVQELVPAPLSERRVLVAAGAAISPGETSAAAELAVQAARVVRADVVEVDLIRSASGEWMVLDLNVASGLSESDGRPDILVKVIDRLLASLSSHDSSRTPLPGAAAGYAFP